MKISVRNQGKESQMNNNKTSNAKSSRWWWLNRVNFESRYLSLVYALLLVAICSSICLVHQASASETGAEAAVAKLNLTSQESSSSQHQQPTSKPEMPVNHRMSHDESTTAGGADQKGKSKLKGGRQSRQYDGPVSASSTGSYAAISSDGGAYVSQLPISTSANYGSGSSSSNYASELAGNYHPSAYYHDPMLMARGYSPQLPLHHSSQSQAYQSPISPLSSMLSMSGPLSGTSLMGKGFDISEIVCSAIAVAIGAVIVGAPFILIYLFIMNHMNNGGAGGPGMGPSAGPITLTGPNSSNNSGRKKRHTGFPEALFKQLSPFVNSEQVANTFKVLMNSISKYQV